MVAEIIDAALGAKDMLSIQGLEIILGVTVESL
jgi:hypothetical protein